MLLYLSALRLLPYFQALLGTIFKKDCKKPPMKTRRIESKRNTSISYSKGSNEQ
jgi:hypothetical protein